MKLSRTRTKRTGTSRGKIYFFSDAHLGLGEKADELRKEQYLVRFVESIRDDAEQVFIVGDLFDYWFEYKTVVPKGYFRLFAKLSELTEQGTRVCFIVGNHDFWVKDYFRDELGMEVFPEPLEVELRGKRFLLHHGDGLLSGDRGYRILKKILRNKMSIFLFSLIHPDIAGTIARWSSRTSRKHTSNRKYESDGMVAFALQKLREGFDFVIMGHNHIPSYHRNGKGVYVNLGDWIREHTYAVFDGKRLELKRWTGRAQ
jgi:UDP-2,3-diacylglucosamine hydrolase